MVSRVRAGFRVRPSVSIGAYPYQRPIFVHTSACNKVAPCYNHKFQSIINLLTAPWFITVVMSQRLHCSMLQSCILQCSMRWCGQLCSTQLLCSILQCGTCWCKQVRSFASRTACCTKLTNPNILHTTITALKNQKYITNN